MRLCIKNAQIMDADKDYGIADLYIKDGLIEGINLSGKVDESFDADGKLVTPAFIDLHAHLREPGQEIKEDLKSGLSAAVAGGYGTVVSMANTNPTIDEPGLVSQLVQKAESLGLARLRPAAALSHGLAGKQLTDFAALKKAGAVMITDDGIPVTDSHLMRRACEYALEHDLVIQTHSEDPSLRQKGAMNEGEVSQRLGLPGNPISAETIMIYRDCELSYLTGARVHIAHVSSKRGMQVIEWFKEQGANVTAEVTPHHLCLTDESLETFDPIYKVAPPLRSQEDVNYLREALAKGIVDAIGTDHAPHTQAEKEQDLISAPFGIANIEVTFPLLYSELVSSGNLSLQSLLKLLQTGPAKVMAWDPPSITPNQPADISIIDLESTQKVMPAHFKSKAKFSPWEGKPLKGWPVATFVRGRLAFKKEELLASA